MEDKGKEGVDAWRERVNQKWALGRKDYEIR
jgi:hypothetical protein